MGKKYTTDKIFMENGSLDINSSHDGSDLTVLSISSSGQTTFNNGQITLGGTGRIQGVDTVDADTDAANKAYVDAAVSGGGGNFLPLSGGTLTGPLAGTSATFSGAASASNLSGTNTGDQDLSAYALTSAIPTNNNQLTNGAGYITTSAADGKYLLNTTDTFTGALTINGDIRGNGQQLVLNAGESASYATAQTNEYVYANAEQGLQINSSPDNWLSGWGGRSTSTINDISGSSSFYNNITVGGNQYFNGEFIEGDGKEMFRYSDSWLRINEDNDFTDGIYCGTGILRTDGAFQVGSSGTKFLVTAAGAVTAEGTLTLDNGQIVLGGTGRIQGVDTVSASTDAVNKAYVDTQGTNFLQNEGSFISGDTLLEILETDTSADVRVKLNKSTTTTIERIDDHTAPAGGCFQLNNSYISFALPQYHKLDDDQEYTFELWGKFISGTDTNQVTYLGSSFYGSTKNYLGNSQRYWGESGFAIDSNTNNDGWYFMSGTLGPARGTGTGQIPTAAHWMRLIMLLNYQNQANTVRYCGLKVYKSGKKGANKVTSIYRKPLGSQASSSAGQWLGNVVLDTNGSLFGTNGDFTGDLTVSGGDIFLGGTGRIQGIDTVSATTDAANKAYVDAAAAAVPIGNYVTLATAQTITGAKTINTLKIGSTNKIQFANNDFIRYDDANGVGRFHFDSDGGTNNASVQAATFVGALSGNATSATTAADSNLLDGINSTQFLRSDVDDSFSGAIVSSNRANGIFGTYDSNKTDSIWSMGTAYKNNVNGSNFGNLYGLAYKHTNNTTGGTMAGGHQMVWCANGTGRSAVGDNLWTSGNVIATGTVTGSNLSGTNTGDQDLSGYLPLAGGAMTGNIAMGNKQITGIDELQFNSGVTIETSGADNYLDVVYSSTGAGGIRLWDGDSTLQGYLFGDGGATSSFGLLHGGGNWAVRCLENSYVELTHNSVAKLTTNTSGVTVSGTLTANIVGNSTSQTRSKLAVWSGNTYSIGMMSGFGYGGLGGNTTGTDYAMSFQMSNSTNRGWWWGDTSHTNLQGAMSLTTTGKAVIATSLSIGYGESTRTAATQALEVNGTVVANAIKLKSGGTEYLNTSTYSSSAFIYGYASGSTIYFGQPATWTQNIRVAGNISGVSYTTTSDKRLKDNIKPIGTKHLNINWKNFELKSEPGIKRTGVIAQELEESHPEFVKTDEKGFKSVAYTELLIAKIAELELRINKLEKQ